MPQSIEQAIATIEQFSESPNTQEKIPLLLKKNLTAPTGHSTLFFEEFKNSVELIKIYATHIAVLESGTPLEKELADRVKVAIAKYNAIIRETNSWGKKVRSFFTKLTHKEPKFLTEIPLVNTKYSLSAEKETSSKISSILSTDILEDKFSVKQYEKDIFLFKAVQLLQKEPLLEVFSKKDLENALFQTPLSCMQIKENNQILVEQQISLFPGETFKINAHFQRDLRHPQHAFLIKESFKNSIEAIQDGFPDTLQHIGCPLNEVLFPFNFYKEAPKEIESLFSKKNTLAQELLPNGKHNLHAKKLLKKRIDYINSAHELLFPLLKEVLIAYTLLKDPLSDQTPIDAFFLLAQTKENPFLFIASINKKASLLFIKEILFSIKKAWLFNKQEESRESTFRKKLHEIERYVVEHHPKEVAFYLIHIGRALAEATKHISMMHMDKQISFDRLSLKTIQLLFFQLHCFLKEYEKDEECIENDIYEQLVFEKKLLSSKTTDHPLLIQITEWHLKSS